MKKSLLFLLLTLLGSTALHAYDAYAGQSEYEAALAAITEGIYYIVTDVNGTKYYVTTEGGLTNDKENGGLFIISKDCGDAQNKLYDIGILVDPRTGSYFSSPAPLVNGLANLHLGYFYLMSNYSRHDWERQVFLLHQPGLRHHPQ